MSRTKYSDLLITYISPFILLSAVCLFVCFLKIKIHHGKKLIIQASSVTFGIYLISDNSLTRSMFVTNKFTVCADMPWYYSIGRVLVGAVGIYIVCSLVDYVRAKLFALLQVRPLCEKLVNFIKGKTAV